jgi:hypothetical protein
MMLELEEGYAWGMREDRGENSNKINLNFYLSLGSRYEYMAAARKLTNSSQRSRSKACCLTICIIVYITLHSIFTRLSARMAAFQYSTSGRGRAGFDSPVEKYLFAIFAHYPEIAHSRSFSP